MTSPLPIVFACFFCGVDSRALLYFFLVFVISLVLASVAFLIWAITKGDFRNVEGAKYDIFNDPEAGRSGAIVGPRLEQESSHEKRI